jgi:hypothetical protein
MDELEAEFDLLFENNPNFQSESENTKAWALNAFKKARQQEIIIGVSNITELITKESVDINGQIVRMHGDARCDAGAYEDLATEALRIADEIINPPEDK